MQFTVTDLLSRMDDLLNDAGRVRWPVTVRKRWLLDAQHAIIAADPTFGLPEPIDLPLVAGRVEQQLSPPNVAALLDVTHNVVGGLVRDSIRYISRAQMDAQRPNWMREAASSTIRYWMPSQGEPTLFYVYPVPKAGVVVRGRIVYFPSSPDNDPVNQIRGSMKSAVLHLAVAYCFMADDTPGDRENVATHLTLAANGMRAGGMADEKVIRSIVERSPPR